MINTIDQERMQSLLEGLSYEVRNTEVKTAFNWLDDKSTFLKESVIQAVLALNNTKQGGNIIIGIRDNKPERKLELVGFNPEGYELQSFYDYDLIRGQIDSFSTSPISAVNNSIYLFNQFDWDNPPMQVIKSDQQKLIERKI